MNFNKLLSQDNKTINPSSFQRNHCMKTKPNCPRNTDLGTHTIITQDHKGSTFRPLQTFIQKHYNASQYTDQSRNALHWESKQERLLDFKKRKWDEELKRQREKNEIYPRSNTRNEAYMEVTRRLANLMVSGIDIWQELEPSIP